MFVQYLVGEVKVCSVLCGRSVFVVGSVLNGGSKNRRK